MIWIIVRLCIDFISSTVKWMFFFKLLIKRFFPKFVKVTKFSTFLFIANNFYKFDRLGQFHTMTKIGEIIRLKRIEISISQKELASQIGVDVSFLCKIEKKMKRI